MSWPLLLLAGYVLLQLALGVWVSRRVAGEVDYLIAGRRLGPLLVGASVFATWFGAESCVGAAGEVYASGLGAVASDPFGYGLCVLLFGLVLAAPLWRRGLVTLADLFRERFSPGVERLVCLLLVPSSLFWAAAQLSALSTVLAHHAPVSREAALLLATGVCLGYTALGGMLADAWTDLLQGAVLVVALVVLLVAALADAGGAALVEAVRAAPPATAAPLATLEAWAVPILGSLFAQELVARVLSARSASVARRATLGAGVAYLAIGSIPVLLGLLARAELPGLADGEAVLPALAEHHLGLVGQVVLSGALVSAILSTIDSALLVSGGLVSHNLLRPRTDRAALRLARVSVVVLGVAAYALARGGGSVHDLVAQASAFGSAGVVVAGLFGLFTGVGGARSAAGALVAGAATWAVGEHVGFAVPFLAALAAATVAYLALAVSPRRAGA